MRLAVCASSVGRICPVEYKCQFSHLVDLLRRHNNSLPSSFRQPQTWIHRKLSKNAENTAPRGGGVGARTEQTRTDVKCNIAPQKCRIGALPTFTIKRLKLGMRTRYYGLPRCSRKTRGCMIESFGMRRAFIRPTSHASRITFMCRPTQR